MRASPCALLALMFGCGEMVHKCPIPGPPDAFAACLRDGGWAARADGGHILYQCDCVGPTALWLDALCETTCPKGSEPKEK
jgi:hypothetical protein